MKVLAAGTLLLSTLSSQGPNLIANGNFENRLANWTIVTMPAWVSTSVLTMSGVPSTAATLFAASGSPQPATINQTFVAPEGGSYLLTALLWSNSIPPPGPNHDGVLIEIDNSPSWSIPSYQGLGTLRIAKSFQLTAGSHTIRITHGASDQLFSTVAIDDISIAKFDLALAATGAATNPSIEGKIITTNTTQDGSEWSRPRLACCLPRSPCRHSEPSTWQT